ncbi:MAG: four helix bundle protein [Bauldia sp.]|nr:four helix bundle protein [Bauldia sp.]
MGIDSYRDLRVWQQAMELTEICYRLTSAFPRDELFGLTSQIRRASVSIAANIAEGYGRESAGSYAHFLRVAQGSPKLETLLLLSERVELAPSSATRPALDLSDATGRMHRGLIRSIAPSD